MNYYFWGSVIGFVSIYSSYKGYFYMKEKLYNHIIEKVNEKLKNDIEDEDLFKPLHKNSSAVINVKHNGKTHPVYIPYDRRKSVSMLRKRVFLLKDDQKEDMTQKPGVPYLVSAKDLGGDSIIVEDLSGEFLKSYTEDEIPGFL